MRSLVLGVALAAAGCNQQIGSDGDGEFLTLDAYTLVDAKTGSLQGFLRWSFVDADPSRVDEPGLRCETWERLDLASVAPAAACPACSYQFAGEASVDETTCSDVDWSRRAFDLGFAPLDSVDAPLADYADDGYAWAVLTRWSPDLGSSDGFQPLFAATPEAWDPESGAAGSGPGEPLQGEHELHSAWFWDLSGS